MTQLNKLVRDNIPGIIEAEGNRVHAYTLDHEDFSIEVLRKVVEEAKEVREALNRDSLIEELGDLREAIDAVMDAWGITEAQVSGARNLKATELGRFKKRQYISFYVSSKTMEPACCV